MESFSTIDLFDTKGMEYLFVIAYLVILIAFWRFSNKQISLKTQVKNAFEYITVGVLRIPQGLFFNKYHTWAHLFESGIAKVGMDDFLQHVTGNIEFRKLRAPGHPVKKGDLITEIVKNGKTLKVYSPLSGEIVSTNQKLFDTPELLNEDPYKKGWLYEIKPTNWVNDTKTYFNATKATDWISKELERLKDFLMMNSMPKYSTEPSMLVLQDGGELSDHILADLPADVWHEFQSEFLDPVIPKD